MKKFRILYLIYLIIITIVSFSSVKETSQETKQVTIYFADKQMMRLIPVDYYISADTPQDSAERIVRELVKERNYDSNIKTILPSEKKAISVKVKNEIATVNIKAAAFNNGEKGRIQEQLIVYQLVNSLSSVEGVSRVKFLIDGEIKKNFYGFIDMRDAFVPDYCI